MGIDVVMWAVTDLQVTDEQLSRWSEKARDAFNLSSDDPVFAFADPGLIVSSGLAGKTVIELWTLWRFYGEGYERGPLPEIYFMAEWLERNIPGAEVRYGGDTTYDVPPPWPKAERDDLIAHFCEYGRP